MNDSAIQTMMSGEVLARWPGAAQVFLGHGMACPGCVMAPFETVRESARNYGLDPDRFARELIRFLGLGRTAAGEEEK